MNHICKTIIAIFLIVGVMCSYSCSLKEPLFSQIVQGEALTDHVVDIISYTLPKGYFRGVFWSSESPHFEIWIISWNKIIGKKTLYYTLLVPPEFIDNIANVTDEWIIEESVLSKNKMTYLIKNNDESKVIRLNMPFREQHFKFTISKNDNGDEIVLFMDISEYVIGNGIFGYAIIKNKDISID